MLTEIILFIAAIFIPYLLLLIKPGMLKRISLVICMIISTGLILFSSAFISSAYMRMGTYQIILQQIKLCVQNGEYDVILKAIDRYDTVNESQSERVAVYSCYTVLGEGCHPNTSKEDVPSEK